MDVNLIPKVGEESVWPSGEGYVQYIQSATYWLEACYEEASLEYGESEDLRKVTEYVDYLMGKQWPSGMPSYRAKPVNNRVWRLFWELVSLLTDLRPTFTVKATNKNFESHGDVLNKCIMSWWLDSNADQHLAMCVVYALLSTAYAKLEWNPFLRNGEGDFQLLPLGPSEVLPLKARHHLDDAQGVIYQTVQPLGFFRSKYPLRGWAVEAQPEYSRYALPLRPPGGMSPLQFNALSAQMKVHLTGNRAQFGQSSYPMALYREFWLQDASRNESRSVVHMAPTKNWGYIVAPGEPLYPRGRLIVMGGRHVLHDGPNPYWHGKHPFAALRMNIVPWQFAGVSDMKVWAPRQDAINQILAGVLNMIKKAVNPAFVAPEKAFSDAAWNQIDWSMPGAKAAYKPMGGAPPQWAPQPQLPGFVLPTMQGIAAEMDQDSLGSQYSQALAKKQVPGGDTLDQIRDAKTTPVRLKGRNIEVFCRDLGSRMIPNIFQFYSTKRRMFMLGNEGATWEDFDWEPGSMVPSGKEKIDHMKSFAFMIKPGTMLNINQRDIEQKLLLLRKNRDIDRQTLYEQLNMPDVKYSVVEARLRAEAQEEAAIAAAAGGGRRR